MLTIDAAIAYVADHFAAHGDYAVAPGTYASYIDSVAVVIVPVVESTGEGAGEFVVWSDADGRLYGEF